MISTEQRRIYEPVYSFFETKHRCRKNMPEVLTKLNVYRDGADVLRVKAKFEKSCANLILLPKESPLTTLVVRNAHETLGHAGIYPVIKELRTKFWIEKCFSAVSKILKKCVVCRKIHERPIKLNQNDYRQFRTNPPRRPYKSVFLDYIGPFIVNLEGKRTKVWLLAITCLWSRAVNLEICRDASTEEFLRALQLHCYKFGVFSSCVSDLGSQIQAGANILRAFLADYETKRFLGQNGIEEVSFQHYAKGNSALGSLIEVCVKQVKHLIQKSIRKIVLDFFDFHFLIQKVIHLINKRPIAFKDRLRSLPPDQLPACITPELLIRGYESSTINVVPFLQTCEGDSDPDYDGSDGVRSDFLKLKKVRERLVDAYHEDFLTNLLCQAVDKAERYKPVKHMVLKPGDIVLLADKFLKRYCFPMGRVLSVDTNSMGEVTAAHVLKGDTKEQVYRHVTSLILVLPAEEIVDQPSHSTVGIDSSTDSARRSPRRRPLRSAAQKCKVRLQQSSAG